ncbi:MAG: acetyl-CoA acetyltransferase [Chloroflexi bacterium]|nr:acetyl-CoA acetyltransferase [Chloroflexota bacterium]
MARTPRDKVAIVGVAESDFGTVPDKTVHELHAQAAVRAVEDAGIDREEIDGLFSCGGADGLHVLQLSEYLGIHPRFLDSTQVGGSSWETFIEHAVLALEAGRCSTALLVYGSTAKSDVARRLRSADAAFSPRGPNQYEAPFGPTLISKYAMVARRHMYQYGTTSEQLAAIAVATRKNATRNPLAVMQKPITVEDVLGSRLIADPLHLLDCCLRTDGGGAVLLTTAERARSLRKPPVWVIGMGSAESHLSMSQMEDMTVSPAVRSGAAAFAEAGITPADVDVLQLYDAFTIMVLLTLEALGFCKPGEGGPFVEDGKLAYDGALPTNTDGGGLSSNHPGMRGIFLLIEATRQLRGESTAQVPDPRIAVCNATGGFMSHCGTIVLAKE